MKCHYIHKHLTLAFGRDRRTETMKFTLKTTKSQNTLAPMWNIRWVKKIETKCCFPNLDLNIWDAKGLLWLRALRPVANMRIFDPKIYWFLWSDHTIKADEKIQVQINGVWTTFWLSDILLIGYSCHHVHNYF